MNLVDSSGWLEFFSDGKNAKHFAPVIENTSELLVSTINIYEVFKKTLAEMDESAALQVAAIMRLGRVIDVSTSISLSAARISYKHKIPMADSIIYATAKKHNAIVWTQDKDFKKLDNVKYFTK